MTTYTQSLINCPKRTNKMAVREFLLSLFKDKHLRKIVGLAGPNINAYIDFLKARGFKEFEIYEMDRLTLLQQMFQLKDSISLKLGDILNANPSQLDTLYDLDYCVTVRHMHEHIAKFKKNFIMTFARRVSDKETIGTFFTVRNETVTKTYICDTPLKHTVYETDGGGKYVYIAYRDTSAMCCIAKIA